MTDKRKHSVVSTRLIRITHPIRLTHLILLLLAMSLLFLGSFQTVSAEQATPAPDFNATDADGKTFSLSDFRGEPVILHITNIEVPLCRECEKSLRGQVEALAELKAENSDATIITLNLRKNPYSKDGRTLIESWWKVNVTWPWIEDIEPYTIGSKYVDYWTVRDGFSNPTILLIDKEGKVAGVYHVYRVGEGVIDDVQDAKTLSAKLESLNTSQWTGLEGEISRQNVSALGMFFLGIVTSLAPCSIALMIAIFSYIMTMRRKDEYLQKSISTSREGFMIGVAFTLGMGLVFFVLGLFVSQIGVFVRDSRFFDLIAGVIMIFLGITNLKPLEEIIEPLTSRMRRDIREGAEVRENGDGLIHRSVKTSIGLFKYSAFIGAFSLGIFFALGWAPCALSMVFPVLIWLASQNVTPLAGGMMLFIFGLGHGVPIIPISTFSRTVGARIGEKYVSAGQWTTKIFGLLVIAVGVVYAARYFGFALW
ncbi:MAG: cytochrome c biogenesis protein CcdA [Methanotrichaceae archaeon]|nr:cytochrome c biogenesis protein CcdA [Methanotrichaceae archaeon]